MELEFSLRRDGVGRRLEERPFNTLVLANFSGHGSAEAGALAERRIAAVDFERLESLWSLFAPHLELGIGSATISVAPRDLDDFHPDHLYQTQPLFAQLRATRRALLDPASAQDTLNDLMATGAVAADEPGPDSGEPASTQEDAESDGMFERLLGKPAGSGKKTTPASGEPRLEKYIHDLISPHIVEDPDPRVETAIESVDLAVSELMRKVLHHPEFQALESAWRSLHEMVACIELSETLQLFACNVRREELLMGLPDPGEGLDDCALFNLLVNRKEAVDDVPWAVIAGDYFFAPQGEDIALLTALGAAAAANGGVFLGGASPLLLGCNKPEDLSDPKHWSKPGADSLWPALRQSDIADCIGLALPRVIARLPYGERTEPTERFDFEELPQPDHAAYLWSNPAYTCARLLAEGFMREGWSFEPGSHVDLGALPAHNFEVDGETHLKPCAEVLIPESAMVAMLEEGLIPLVSYRDRNTAVLGRFQSIADPPAPLAGPWCR